MCTVFSRYQPISRHVPNEIYVIDEHLRASCKREKKHRNTNKMVKSWLTHKVIESALKLDRYKDYWQRLLQHYAVPIYAFISKPHTSTQKQWNNRKSFFPVLITSSRGFVRIVIAGYNFHVIAWNFGRVLCVWVFGCKAYNIYWMRAKNFSQNSFSHCRTAKWKTKPNDYYTFIWPISEFLTRTTCRNKFSKQLNYQLVLGVCGSVRFFCVCA